MTGKAKTIADREAIGRSYCEVMEEIKRRSSVVETAINRRTGLPGDIAGELCYLQLRMVCELIAVGCLIAHGDIEATQTKKLRKAYEPDVIIKTLERLHPEFYPQPSKQINDDKGNFAYRVEPITSGFLTKTELIKLWAECGSFLHRGGLKALQSPTPKLFDFNQINAWYAKIVTLLGHHQIQLIDPKLQMWVLMQARQDGRVHYSLMEGREGPPPYVGPPPVN
jgi:hypothetical protein